MEMSKKYYLYVPYEYKQQAKELGAKWDADKKKWYTIEENINYLALINTYRGSNFYTNYNGTHMKPQTKSLKEESDEENDKKEHYKQTLANHIEKGGSDDDNFRKNYSVNYRNCE